MVHEAGSIGYSFVEAKLTKHLTNKAKLVKEKGFFKM